MQSIFDYIEDSSEKYIKELCDLCANRSVKGDKRGLQGTKKQIVEKLERLCFEIDEKKGPSGVPIIIAKRREENGPNILFYNHYDVVPEGKRSEWEHDPYDPVIKDGVIYGRGVSDNKGGLLARLQAMEAIIEKKGKLPCTVTVLYDGEEESESDTIKYFLKNSPEHLLDITDADLCIWENGRVLPDGSPEAAFGVRCMLAIELTVKTSNGDEHGRMGAELPNAAWRLIWALASLKNKEEEILLDGFYDDVLEPTEEDIKVVSAYPYDDDEILKNKEIDSFVLGLRGEKLKEKIFLHPSMTICGLEAGQNHEQEYRNIVPNTAMARISVILVPNQKAEDILRKIERHLEKNGFSDIKVSCEACDGFPVRTELESPWRAILEKAAKRVYERPLTASITQLGSGPAYMIRSISPNIPIICACGVSSLTSGNHSTRENVRVKDYINGIKYTVSFLEEVAVSWI